MPKLIQKISPACMLPPFYGVAWVDHASNKVIALPVPFNVAASFGRAVWIWLKFGYRPVRIDPRDAYQQGYKAGIEQATPAERPKFTEIVITTNPAGECVAVTRQDMNGRIVSIIWERQ